MDFVFRAGLFAQEVNLATLSLFPFCLSVPVLPHSQQSLMRGGFKCSLPLRQSPAGGPWFQDSRDSKHRWVGK